MVRQTFRNGKSVGALLLLALGFMVLGSGEAHAQTRQAVVTANRAPVRAKPGPRARIVGRVENGSVHPALGMSGDKRWVRIRFKGREAWISARAVRVERASGGGDSWATATRNAQVRTGASNRAPAVASVSRGDYVKFLGFSKNKRFVRIQTRDGSSGWVAKTDVLPGKRPDLRSARRSDPFAGGGSTGSGSSSGAKPPKGGGPVVQGDPPKIAVAVTPTFMRLMQSVETSENFQYSLGANALVVEGRVRYNLKDNFIGGFLDADGAFMFGKAQDIPAPNTDPVVLLSAFVQRLELGTTYTRPLMPAVDIIATGGYRLHMFYIQPQTLSFYLTNSYHTLNLSAGGRYRMGNGLSFDGKFGLLPGLLIESFGRGQTGSSGNSPLALGFEAIFGVGYSLGSLGFAPEGSSAGAQLGVTSYGTQFQGVGKRAGVDIENTFVRDTIISLGASVSIPF